MRRFGGRVVQQRRHGSFTLPPDTAKRRPSRKRKWIFGGLGTFLGLPTAFVGLLVWNKFGREHRPAVGVSDRPLIAFSGSFWLWGYYWGVAAYLLDHFDMRTVNISSVSAGCTALIVFLMEDRLVEAFAFGQYLLKQLPSRKKGMFLLEKEEFGNWVDHFFSGVGITDEYLQDRTSSGADVGRYMIGYSAVNKPKFEMRVLHEFKSIRQLSEACNASMCTPPFWSGPLKMTENFTSEEIDGRASDRAADGGLCGNFLIPDQYVDRPELIVKVDVYPKKDSNCVAPPKFYPPQNYFQPNSLETSISMFRDGYNHSREKHDEFLRIGVSELRPSSEGSCEIWVSKLRDAAQQIEDGTFFSAYTRKNDWGKPERQDDWG